MYASCCVSETGLLSWDYNYYNKVLIRFNGVVGQLTILKVQ